MTGVPKVSKSVAKLRGLYAVRLLTDLDLFKSRVDKSLFSSSYRMKCFKMGLGNASSPIGRGHGRSRTSRGAIDKIQEACGGLWDRVGHG